MTHEDRMKRVMYTLSRAKFTEYSMEILLSNGETLKIKGLKYRHLCIDKRSSKSCPFVITHIPTQNAVGYYDTMERAKIAAVRFADLVTSVMTPADVQSPDFKYKAACYLLRDDAEADISKFYDPDAQEQEVVVPAIMPQRRPPPPPARRQPPAAASSVS